MLMRMQLRKKTEQQYQKVIKETKAEFKKLLTKFEENKKKQRQEA